LFDALTQDFNAAFYNPSKHIYDIGVQTTRVMPMYLSMVPESDVQNMTIGLLNDIVSLQNYHLTTGILGTKYLMETLWLIGRTGIHVLFIVQSY
jgi:alpha-L-rhamnosidase